MQSSRKAYKMSTCAISLVGTQKNIITTLRANYLNPYMSS